MMLQSFIKMLLVVYGLSIIGSGTMEAGHALLHSIKNTLHHHDHGHHHSLEDHQLKISQDVPDAASDAASSTIVCSYFLFFENCALNLFDLSARTIYPELILSGIPSPSCVPFVPPPVS
jgi:hypothetical protein